MKHALAFLVLEPSEALTARHHQKTSNDGHVLEEVDELHLEDRRRNRPDGMCNQGGRNQEQDETNGTKSRIDSSNKP